MSKEDKQPQGGVKSQGKPFIDAHYISEIAPYWLSAIIESADDAIVSKTLEGIITSWNKGAERLFGYAAEEVIGKPILILIPPELHYEEDMILSRIRRGERIQHYEAVRVRKDGTHVYISLTVSPIKDDKGKIIGASKIARDITDRKLAEARLKEALAIAQEAREQAEVANRLKDEFLATISHELRTPLTATLGWVQLLIGNRLNEDLKRKALETIYRNVKSQAHLIEDLLDISRMVNGKMRLEIAPLDPIKLIDAAVETIKPAADAKNIRLEINHGENVGMIKGDFERLQQVVWNLLSNAVKFTENGGLIQVRLQRLGSVVKIHVSDTGIGIEPEFLPRIFDRFTQADSSTTRKFGGIGMGLAIVKSIVEIHGGIVSVNSEGSGKGATFTVVMPALETSKDAFNEKTNEETQLSESSTFEYPAQLNGLEVLVVDDQAETCEMVGAALEQCGSKVTIAFSAAEALEKLERQLPDVLVADLSMPEMDGFDLIRQIRKRSPDKGGQIPAVAFTAMSRIEDRMQALSAGSQMYIVKPVNIAELRSVVADLAATLPKNKARDSEIRRE